MRVAGRALTHNLLQLGPLVLPMRERWRYAMSWLARALIDRDREPYKPSFDRAFDHFCIHTGGRGILDSLEKQLSLSPAHLAPSRETLKRYGNTSSSSIWCATFPTPFADVPRCCGVPRTCTSLPVRKQAWQCPCRQVGCISSLHQAKLPRASRIGPCLVCFGMVSPALRPLACCRYVLAYIETAQGLRRGDRVWQLAFGSGFKVNSAVWRARRTFCQHHAAFLDKNSKAIVRSTSMP